MESARYYCRAYCCRVSLWLFWAIFLFGCRVVSVDVPLEGAVGYGLRGRLNYVEGIKEKEFTEFSFALSSIYQRVVSMFFVHHDIMTRKRNLRTCCGGTRAATVSTSFCPVVTHPAG